MSGLEKPYSTGEYLGVLCYDLVWNAHFIVNIVENTNKIIMTVVDERFSPQNWTL